jgi:hypothetical protein
MTLKQPKSADYSDALAYAQAWVEHERSLKMMALGALHTIAKHSTQSELCWLAEATYNAIKNSASEQDE